MCDQRNRCVDGTDEEKRRKENERERRRNKAKGNGKMRAKPNDSRDFCFDSLHDA